MNCEQIRDRLSAYYDGELDENIREEIREHLEGCPECARELQVFRGMTALFEECQSIPSSSDTERNWRRLQGQLHPADGPRTLTPSESAASQRGRWATYLVAALVLLAAGITLSLNVVRHDGHGPSDLNLNAFVVDFAKDPQLAQERLLTQFGGRSATVDEVVEVFKKEPSVVTGLPKDYRLVSLNLVKMPCCTCPQAVLQNKDGKTVCVFEHEPKTGVLVNGCSMIRCRCCERNVKIAEVGTTILASWPSKESTITAVGFGSIEEMVEFVESIERTKEQAFFRREEISVVDSD